MDIVAGALVLTRIAPGIEHEEILRSTEPAFTIQLETNKEETALA